MDPQTQRSQAGGADTSSEGSSDPVTTVFPPRYSSHGAVASHFQAFGGETWMDFLRESGTDPPVNHQQPPNNPAVGPPDIRSRQVSASSSTSRYTLPNRPLARTDSRSADRKRRLTAADSPMRRPSSIRMHSSNAGSSADPIVLDSSPTPSRMSAPLPPLPPPTPPSNADPTRRPSDVVLPRWQPDSDVTQCPVCSRTFTFLFRKHHCRKCGRVVCSSCSPHRITIPRQFIVHPPTDNMSDIIDLTGDDDSAMSPFGPFRNPALGGGEEVRVCNPCVPDPNYSPPPQYNPAAPSRYSTHLSSASRPPFPHPQLQQSRPYRTPSGVPDASQTIGHRPTRRQGDYFNNTGENRRVSYHGSSNAAERWLPPLPDSSNPQPSRSYHQDASISHFLTSASPNYAPHPPNFHSSSFTSSNNFSRPMPPQPPALQPQHSQHPRPHRQIAEEDECPVCGHELPPKGHNNDDAARTRHIEECITMHSASPAPAPPTSTSLPNQRARGMSNAGEGASNSNRLSLAARGMFPYTATEKDCVDDEGREAECIICLEDFEAGDKMARLVCWCKFHEKCIKEWWDKKGRGACPTHQLQE